jgi:L-seryl-tRNA(Ser) seleniumtransferase
LVTASGDKLLGGPQCGLLLGDGDLVASLRQHPFARALGVDKLTLAALEATLTGPTPPVPAALKVSRAALLARAARIVEELADLAVAEVVESSAAVGGGGAPDVGLPSAAVALPPWFARPLRVRPRPVVGHLERGRLLLDLLAVDPDDDGTVVEAVRAVAREPRD